ncbi:MAG: SDR family oxidoreductase [Acidimicrobiia bacterium]|nr:SDR family oxidoreductase [Acidimicrobiia bacterium]
MSTVVVTGARGYVGGRLETALRERHRVVVVDRTTDAAGLKEACTSADAVVHLAGANEILAAENPELALAETVSTTWRTARAAAEGGVRRFVYVSTVHVYGPPVEGAVLDESTMPAPRGAYAVARLASEHAAASHDLDLVVLRLTNAVGAPGRADVQRWTLVANDLCRQAALTGALRLRSHGWQWRDFVPMADAVRILEAAADPEAVPAGTYNLGSGTPTTVRNLAELVQDAFEALTGDRPPLHAPEGPDERPQPHRVSVQRLADLGLRADGDLSAAVEETAAFCLAHREELPA